jgi:fructokinase
LHKKIVCFGEMLWDVFPTGKIAGGAPMNLALHLCQLGDEVSFISGVGADVEGQNLLAFIERFGLNPELIQTHPNYPTGKVLVNNSDKENITYDIVKPAAWDQIAWSPEQQEKVDQADAFIYGSLATREETSRKTLLKLLETKSLKVLDINLRPPFYNFEILEDLLFLTDVLKTNEEELKILAALHQLPDKVETVLEKLTELYDLSLICVTMGKNGALLYYEEDLYSHPGYQVEVRDTVGSGDAFLAAFVNSHLKHLPPERILDDACALGALVASLPGGTPTYSPEDVKKIKQE